MPSDESKGSQLDAIGSLAQRQLDNTLQLESYKQEFSIEARMRRRHRGSSRLQLPEAFKHLTVLCSRCPPYFALPLTNGVGIQRNESIEQIADPPMVRRCRSWRRHRAERVPAYQRLSPSGRSEFTRLEANEKSLDSDRVCCLRVFTGAAATRPNSTAAGTSPA